MLQIDYKGLKENDAHKTKDEQYHKDDTKLPNESNDHEEFVMEYYPQPAYFSQVSASSS